MRFPNDLHRGIYLAPRMHEMHRADPQIIIHVNRWTDPASNGRGVGSGAAVFLFKSVPPLRRLPSVRRAIRCLIEVPDKAARTYCRAFGKAAI